MPVRFIILLSFALLPSAKAEISPKHRQFFETKIRPVLVKQCYDCHSAKKMDKIRFDQPITPVQATGIVSIFRGAKKHSAHKPMPEQTILDFEQWVKLGAPWPTGKAEASNESLWAFQPIGNPNSPKVQQADWPRDKLDHFVLARMEGQKLQPTGDASSAVLIRRLYYDLTGLPPSVEEVEAFQKAATADHQAAVEKLVDRLLASQHFGERWGRHWLDVARYGESNGDDGLGRNASFPHAWRYRDYVIDAFNRDTPYDRFLAEQIAGDLLSARDDTQRDRHLVATGFLALGAKPAKAMNNNFAMDVVADQINVVSTVVMGLSVACARCHDHKHDPIPTRDYYALAGIFTSTETLWGRAANEGLTAPATPLHELKTMNRKDAEPDPTLKQTASVPKFSEGYTDAIAAMKPDLHLPLDKMPAGFTKKKDVKFNKANAGAFNGGWIEGKLKANHDAYTVSFWFRNDLENDARAVTGYMFSRGQLGAKGAPGDQVGIGGNYQGNPHAGKIFFFNGNDGGASLPGRSIIPPRTWNHLVFVRDGKRVRLHLNGDPKPEVDAEAAVTTGGAQNILIGGRNDFFAMTLTGNLTEFALFPRALSASEAQQLHTSSGRPKGSGKVLPPQRKPAPSPKNLAMGVREAKKVGSAKINRNGESNKLGAAVPRGFLTATQMADAVKINYKQSGRRQLAEWLTHPKHPLTARVMANRVWLHLFGRGIVTTPDDFGVYGNRPTHPELLDHLAQRFMADNWSVKKLIRTIVLSRAYQLGSRATSAQMRADPDNQWFARHNRRRLDAESIRDSILAASGQLNQAPGEGSDVSQLDVLINWPPGESAVIHRPSNHRSIYLCHLRHAPPPDLTAFDVPDGTKPMGQRHVITAPPSALYLMNNRMVIEQSRHFAAQLLKEAPADDAGRTRWAFRRALQRNPTAAEISHVIGLVEKLQKGENPSSGKTAWATLAQALLNTSEFRYID